MGFILSYLAFLASVFVAFYVPGRVLLGKVSFPRLARISVSIVIGIVLWAFQGILFGYLHARWLSYPYLLFFIVLFIKQKYYALPLSKEKLTFDIPAIFLILLGSISQVFAFVITGIKVSQGIIISPHNPGDHIWHAALVQELIKRFPPNEPAIAGVTLKDYHYFYNMVAAELIRVFHLPFFMTQFDGLYVLAPILFGILAYQLARYLWASKSFVYLFLFFLYFSGDAAGWVMLVMHHTFTWNILSLINNATTFVDSPPYAYALIIGFTGMYLLLQYKDVLPKKIIFISMLLFGSLIEFKVYVGIPFLLAFGAYTIPSLLKKKFTPFISFFLAGLLATLVFKLNSSSSAGLFFLPVDIPRDFINQKVWGLIDWQLRWVIYQQHHNIPRLIEYGTFMAAFYLLVQFGLQLLGLFPLKKTWKILELPFLLFVVVEMFSGLLLGLFFYQSVGGANIWEFFRAVAPLLSLVAALNIAVVIKKWPLFLQASLLFLVVIIVIPRWIMSTNTDIHVDYLSGFHGITNARLASYTFLENNTPANSLIMTIDQKYSYASPINLFVTHDLYLSGMGVRQIMTPTLKRRIQEVKTVAMGTNSQQIRTILHDEHISYVYFYGAPQYPQVLQAAGLTRVFTNRESTIFKTQ